MVQGDVGAAVCSEAPVINRSLGRIAPVSGSRLSGLSFKNALPHPLQNLVFDPGYAEAKLYPYGKITGRLVSVD